METNPCNTLDSPVAQKVLTGLAKIGLVARHHAWRQATSQSLTPTQGEILSLLRSHPTASLRLSNVAASLCLTQATVSDSVRVLAEKSLLTKNRSKDDGRAIELLLTSTGRRAADRFSGRSDVLRAAVEGLSSSEQEVFLNALIKVIMALQVRGEIPIAKMCVSCKFFRPNVHTDQNRPHHCTLADAAFGNRQLRLDCPKQKPAESDEMGRAWALSVGEGREEEASPQRA